MLEDTARPSASDGSLCSRRLPTMTFSIQKSLVKISRHALTSHTAATTGPGGPPRLRENRRLPVWTTSAFGSPPAGPSQRTWSDPVGGRLRSGQLSRLVLHGLVPPPGTQSTARQGPQTQRSRQDSGDPSLSVWLDQKCLTNVTTQWHALLCSIQVSLVNFISCFYLEISLDSSLL